MTARMVAILLMLVGLAGCGGGGGGGAAAGPAAAGPTGTLQSISVTPANQSLGIGAKQAYTATGNYSDGTTQNLTSTATWSSDTLAVASVSSSGVVSALTLGTANISATASGKTASTPLTVTAITLQSIAITPATVSLAKGAIQGYTATGTYSDASTQDITANSTWTSSAAGVATVGANTGVVTAVAAGTTTLTVSSGGKSANVNISVTANAVKQIASIAVNSSYVTINPSTTKQLTATATYADGSTADVTASATWASSDTASATVSNAGLVSASATGAFAKITASIGAAVGVSNVSITNSIPAALTVTPQTIYTGGTANPIFWVSANFGLTGTTPYSTSFAITGCSPVNAATFDASTGLVTATAVGTCSMTASVDTNAGTVTSPAATLTIAAPYLSTIAVIPAAPTVGIGSTLQLTAIGTFVDGSTQDITNSVNWTSLSQAFATVSTTGLVTGVANGTAQINAQKSVTIGLNLYSKVGSTTVTVPVAAPVAAATTVSGASVIDNTVTYSSLVPSYQKTSYPVNAWSSNSLGVGCNWYLMYDPIASMNIQNLTCAQALVFFNLSSIPAGKTITSASLQLQTNTFGVGYVPRTWHIYALANANWNGNTVTWDNSSSFMYYTSSVVSRIAPPSPTNMSYNIDVTNTVRNWYSGAWTNSGFELGLDDMLTWPYMISLDAFQFYSSEDPNGRGPKLVVNYQ